MAVAAIGTIFPPEWIAERFRRKLDKIRTGEQSLFGENGFLNINM